MPWLDGREYPWLMAYKGGVRRPPLSVRGIFRVRLDAKDVYRNWDFDGIG